MSESHTRSRLDWSNSVFLIVSPIAALVLVPLHVTWNGIHWSEIASLFLLWGLTGLGITAGYHRLFAHRAWAAPAPVRLAMAVLGAATWQTSAITWVANHRQHHKHVDTEADPYNAKRGLFFSHMGWVMRKDRPYFRDAIYRNVPDLWKDPICVWQHRRYLPISVGFNLGVPILLGLASGRIAAMLLFAGLVRVVLVHHVTFCINSFAHRVGRQPWSEGFTARDNGLLSVLTLGEGYHNYHHSFPADYRNGVRWYHADPTKWFIWVLSRLGLAFNLRRSSLDQQVRQRFVELRRRYQARLGQYNEAATARLVEAEARLERAMTEFHRIRVAWSEKIDNGFPGREYRELKRAYRGAHRALTAEFRSWERLALACAA